MRDKNTPAGKLLLTVTSMLLLLALTACSQKPVIVLSEARTIKLMQGESAPWSGWLLTDGALTILLEELERDK